MKQIDIEVPNIEWLKGKDSSNKFIYFGLVNKIMLFQIEKSLHEKKYNLTVNLPRSEYNIALNKPRLELNKVNMIYEFKTIKQCKDFAKNIFITTLENLMGVYINETKRL